jgi:murein L,D-transpeptidase YafK
MKIYVYKTLRLLLCLDGDEVVLRAQIQLGSGGDAGPKLREGDGRTPEGHYHISSRNPKSKFHLSLGISYPNAADARRGRATGLIDASCLERILASPGRPPWDTPLGGFIMIHGQPNDGARSGDWTAGCIALENSAMKNLYALANIGDEVIILP